MRFSTAAVFTGLAAVSVQGSYAPPAHNATTPVADHYTTEVVHAYTTYCPEATQITHGGSTWTVTEATTLVMSYATGVTVTKPVYTSSCSESSTASVVVPAKPTYASVGTVSPYKPTNGTTPVVKSTGSYATPSGYATPTPKAATGDAAKISFGAAGLLAVFGLVAAL